MDNSSKSGSKKSYTKKTKRTDPYDVYDYDNADDFADEWVSKKTEGMIPSILDDSDSDLVMGLANALYFDSEWENPYEDEDTSKGKFHNANRSTVDVTYLNSREHSYIENGFFTGFTKRYEGRFDFMALLPKKTGRRFLEGMLDDIDLMEIYRSAEFGTVKASIPEYKYGFSEELTKFCKERGIKKAFTPEADFTPMTDKPAWLSTIIHKAAIEVNQAGTRAAAVTFGGMVGALPDFDQKVHVVKLNRQFLYAIVHRATGIPVFVRMVNEL